MPHQNPFASFVGGFLGGMSEPLAEYIATAPTRRRERAAKKLETQGIRAFTTQDFLDLGIKPTRETGLADIKERLAAREDIQSMLGLGFEPGHLLQDPRYQEMFESAGFPSLPRRAIRFAPPPAPLVPERLRPEDIPSLEFTEPVIPLTKEQQEVARQLAAAERAMAVATVRQQPTETQRESTALARKREQRLAEQFAVTTGQTAAWQAEMARQGRERIAIRQSEALMRARAVAESLQLRQQEVTARLRELATKMDPRERLAAETRARVYMEQVKNALILGQPLPPMPTFGRTVPAAPAAPPLPRQRLTKEQARKLVQ